MKHITLIIWVLTSGTLAAQQTNVQNPTSPLEVILDSAILPIEMYDSASFVNWSGTPSIFEFTAVDQEPVPLNIAEYSSCFGVPAVFREAGISLGYTFRLLIDEQGAIARIVGLKGYGPWLMSLGECVNQLHWSPAMKEGEPVMFWVNWGSRCVMLIP